MSLQGMLRSHVKYLIYTDMCHKEQSRSMRKQASVMVPSRYCVQKERVAASGDCSGAQAAGHSG